MTEVWYLHEALVGIKLEKVLDSDGNPIKDKDGKPVMEPAQFVSLAQARYTASQEKRIKPNSGWFTPVSVPAELTLKEAVEFTLPEEAYVSRF
jgi:hypothetical protein